MKNNQQFFWGAKTCWGMCRGKPCNYCGFEKPFHFLACVCSTASLFLSNNPNSEPKKEYESETHKSKGTKPRN